MDEFPASKVHLQPVRNWVWSKGEIHPFRGGRLKNSTYQLSWAQNPLRHPELSISQQDFPSKDTIIFELPASKHLPEEQIFWGTDPLGAPSSTLELSSLLNVWEILYFGSHSWHLNWRLLRHFVIRYCEQYLYLRASTIAKLLVNCQWAPWVPWSPWIPLQFVLLKIMLFIILQTRPIGDRKCMTLIYSSL